MPARRLPCAFALLLLPGMVAARTLTVGPGKDYPQPSAAIAAAMPGDQVLVSPGTYFDCAVVPTPNLVIEGTDPAGSATLTDKACQGKAILVTTGDNITVRNLTLTRARVPDGNGAGIRDEGAHLTVDHVHFVNNQDGILTGAPENATLTVTNSEFLRNGSCVSGCAHGIYAGTIALLHVENTRFFETKQAHHVKSRAARTEVIDCDIEDGPNGTSSYLIDIPNGGALVARGNTLQKGPQSQNHTAAIMIGEEGVTQPTPEITVTGNRFRNAGDYNTVFVDNNTATEATLKDNTLDGAVKALQGD